MSIDQELPEITAWARAELAGYTDGEVARVIRRVEQSRVDPPRIALAGTSSPVEEIAPVASLEQMSCVRSRSLGCGVPVGAESRVPASDQCFRRRRGPRGTAPHPAPHERPLWPSANPSRSRSAVMVPRRGADDPPAVEPVAQLPDQGFDLVKPRRLHLDDLRKARRRPLLHVLGLGSFLRPVRPPQGLPVLRLRQDPTGRRRVARGVPSRRPLDHRLSSPGRPHPHGSR